MKKILMLAMCIVMLMAGCGSEKENNNNSLETNNEPTSEVSPTESTEENTDDVNDNDVDNSTDIEEDSTTPNIDYENNPPRIDQINWFVEEGMIDGNSSVVFGYTNNSDYIILDVEMKFVQKEGTTKKQRAVFKELKKEKSWTNEEIADIYILGYNRKVAEPGEQVTGSYCCINGTYEFVKDIKQYNIMEPSEVQIAYAGVGDDKVYATSYDFKTGQYTGMGAYDIYEWSDNSLGTLIEKPDFISVKTGVDDEDKFTFTCYGVSKEDYDQYKKSCSDKGFNNVDSDSEHFYEASNSSGEYTLTLNYDSIEEDLLVRIEAADQN